MEHSFQLSNPTSGPKSVHGPLSLWEGRASLLLSSLPPGAPTYSLKTYKRVERNANLGGGTFQSSILPQPHLEMPLWSNNKKGNIKTLSRKQTVKHLLST